MHSEDITKGTTERWHSLGVQPACEQSLGAGHAYTATLDISMPQEGSAWRSGSETQLGSG